jgi:hypothetical protein
MAVLDALLKIRADVQGEGAIASLSRTMGGLNKTAGSVTGGLRGMLGGVGGVSGALGALAPMVGGVGLAAMAKGAIDAADNMNDLAQKTGVSVEQLSRFQQAANAGGSSIEAVGGAMVKLNRNLATQNKGASEALQQLGISATDASGKLKSTDQVMLEVADRFANMPDGAQKSAAAMALFGRSGADLIPMLNGGRDSIQSLTATMSGEFAKGADQLNDKLAAIQGKMLELGVKLGTALMPALNVVADLVVKLADGFSKLPAPVQTTVASLALFAVAWGPITTVLGLFLPLIPAVISALLGFTAWLIGTFLPGVLAVFSGPVGWTVLAIAAVVALVWAFRSQIGGFLSWLGKALGAGLKAAWAIAYQIWVQPWINLWNMVLRKPITDLWNWFATGFRSNMQKAADFVHGIWQALVNGLRGLVNGFFSSWGDRINTVINGVNKLIDAFNKLPGPDIGFIPTVPIPQFAEGGVVDRPTLALVGEAGREYIIPEAKMAAASASYLAGARGATTAGRTQINITTGPVLQAQGEQWVTVGDLERAMRATADGVLARVRTPAGRRLLGVR